MPESEKQNETTANESKNIKGSWNIDVDWKFMTACGLSAFMIILALKMNPDQAREVSKSTIDVCKKVLISAGTDMVAA